jgi:uncharacterized protein (TIGR03437 family)
MTKSETFTAGHKPAALAAADLNGDGKLDLVVGNFDSSNVSVLFGDGKGKFGEKTDYAANGPGVTGVGAGDYDGDGKVDLIAVSDAGIGQVTIYLGGGDGTFRLESSHNSTLGIRRPLVLMADFAGDGKSSMVTARRPDGESWPIGVQIDKKDTPRKAYRTVSNPTQLAAADVNRDGAPDIVVTNQAGEVTVVASPFPPYTIPRGLGAPIIPWMYPAPPATCATPAGFMFTGLPGVPMDNSGFYPRNLTTGDFNGDGKLDAALLVENSGGAATPRTIRVSILLGGGDGTLTRVGTEATDLIVATHPGYGLAAGDVNGDGKLDLLAGGAEDGYGQVIHVLLGKGDGTFTRQGRVTLSGPPNNIRLGDFNKDGKLDMVVLNNRAGYFVSRSVSVLFGRGNGAFWPPFSYALTGDPQSVEVADFNQDGWPDIAANVITMTAANEGVALLLNDGTGFFHDPVRVDSNSWPGGITVGDFDRSGTPDVATVGRESNLYNVFLNKGGAKFDGALYLTCDPYDLNNGGNRAGEELRAGDFDGDGSLDLVVIKQSGTEGNVSILRGKGDGRFEGATNPIIYVGQNLLAVGDFNGDRKPDLLVGNGEAVRVMLNTTPTANTPPAAPPRLAYSVSAANYTSGELATASIISIFGTGLATATDSAARLPLPLKLGGTRVTIKDSFGIVHDAPLFFVSPTQVNCMITESTGLGPATITVWSSDGVVSASQVEITQVTPGIFSADSSGSGLAAATVTRVKADGQRSEEAIAGFDPALNQVRPIAIDLGPEGEQVYLILYGTGWRNRTDAANVAAQIGTQRVPVSFAGAQPNFAGLDQANLLIPRALKGAGEVEITLTVDGKVTNKVKVRIK